VTNVPRYRGSTQHKFLLMLTTVQCSQGGMGRLCHSGAWACPISRLRPQAKSFPSPPSCLGWLISDLPGLRWDTSIRQNLVTWPPSLHGAWTQVQLGVKRKRTRAMPSFLPRKRSLVHLIHPTPCLGHSGPLVSVKRMEVMLGPGHWASGHFHHTSHMP
jgi:hypothetical protein